MSKPYIERSPHYVYYSEEADVYWVVTDSTGGEHVAQAAFYDLESAKNYIHLVLKVPVDEIKIVNEERE